MPKILRNLLLNINHKISGKLKNYEFVRFGPTLSCVTQTSAASPAQGRRHSLEQETESRS